MASRNPRGAAHAQLTQQTTMTQAQTERVVRTMARLGLSTVVYARQVLPPANFEPIEMDGVMFPVMRGREEGCGWICELLEKMMKEAKGGVVSSVSLLIYDATGADAGTVGWTPIDTYDFSLGTNADAAMNPQRNRGAVGLTIRASGQLPNKHMDTLGDVSRWDPTSAGGLEDAQAALRAKLMYAAASQPQLPHRVAIGLKADIVPGQKSRLLENACRLMALDEGFSCNVRTERPRVCEVRKLCTVSHRRMTAGGGSALTASVTTTSTSGTLETDVTTMDDVSQDDPKDADDAGAGVPSPDVQRAKESIEQDAGLSPEIAAAPACISAYDPTVAAAGDAAAVDGGWFMDF